MMKAVRFLLMTTLFVMCGEAALGCSCLYVPPSQGFDEAQAVFTGRVIKAKKSKWTIAVDRVWKGDVQERITLCDAHAGTSCAASYKHGESYLFLVNVKKSGQKVLYSPQVCSWGTRLKSARLQIEGDTYSWVEDLVLKGRGEGMPPVRKFQ